MIRFQESRSGARMEDFLDRVIHLNPRNKIDRLAQKGVDALEAATPRRSGKTAQSWKYVVLQNGSEITIWWTNDHIVDGFKVAIGLQYGHASKGGGYISGEDYINPALKRVFDEIGNAVWEEVQKL